MTNWEGLALGVFNGGDMVRESLLHNMGWRLEFRNQRRNMVVPCERQKD